jgi:hypothetical protein
MNTAGGTQRTYGYDTDRGSEPTSGCGRKIRMGVPVIQSAATLLPIPIYPYIYIM